MAESQYFFNSTNKHHTNYNCQDLQYISNANFNHKLQLKLQEKTKPLSNLISNTFIDNPQTYDSIISNTKQASQSFMTDRYIPRRKPLNKRLICDMDGNEENKEVYDVEPNHSQIQISQLYKKYVMCDDKKPKDEDQSEIYKNGNILKYKKNSDNGTQWETNKKFQESEVWDELSRIKPLRKISKHAQKVLDAPALQNDYYLNLIDWSEKNIISVGLSNSVYLWNGNNSRVTKLCDVGVHDSVCSVSWAKQGVTLAIGSSSGEIKIWDVEKLKKIRTLNAHSNRVSTISWSSTILASGSRDKIITLTDPRSNQPNYRQLIGHKQQICGLKWSPDEQQLCSGGNDNKLFVWNNYSQSPVCKFFDHEAAVKAIAWSPHHHGVLVSGGGTADRTIKFRNTLTGITDKSIKVNSQVCNLAFSKTYNQLVSTHGYSQNEINIWSCPKMTKLAKLTGHTYRVLYLSMSPDGSTIVTGAGDQTLRFWNVFPNNAATKKQTSDLTYQQLR